MIEVGPKAQPQENPHGESCINRLLFATQYAIALMFSKPR
jgi:hypothetical protein